MRKLLVVILLFALLVSACAPSHTELPPNPQALISEGQTVYAENCSRCHQLDGGGWKPLFPRLADNPIVTLSNVSPIIETVLYGQGSMPPFRDSLTAEQIAAVLSYIRNSWGNQAMAVSPRQIH